MRVIGIVAEFNPFHSGHEYLISEAKREVAEPRAIVMPVMSGAFCQRGIPAMLPKHIRARQALLCGADVVLELPFTFACAPSERFASGAIATLVRTGVVTDIAFGVDCEEPEILEELAGYNFDGNEEYNTTIKDAVSSGQSFPAARASAVLKVLSGKTSYSDDKISDALRSPNSILALDYLTALRRYDRNGRIKVHMIRRLGGYHGSDASGFASASDIRTRASSCKTLSQLTTGLAGTMPDASLACWLSAMSKGEFKPLDECEYLRRVLTGCDFREDTAYMTDGVAGYINNVTSALRPKDLDSSYKFYEILATRHFTVGRILRAMASSYVGQAQTTLDIQDPAYIRVLGFGREGRYCLKIINRCTKLPVIHNLSDFAEHGDNSALQTLSGLDIKATELAGDLLGLPFEYEWQTPPVML
ncbi:MAG: nucleotidyltransferase family protein [Clostridiales bacterium]|nr:nucleotidyltransferase family protein [Clostridiales bacterium]